MRYETSCFQVVKITLMILSNHVNPCTSDRWDMPTLTKVGDGASIRSRKEFPMGALVQKDKKNRLPVGPEVEGTYFIREVDERGRVVFTPQVLVAKDEFEERLITLNDAERDRFVESLLSAPQRNAAYKNAKANFDKKYK